MDSVFDDLPVIIHIFVYADDIVLLVSCSTLAATTVRKTQAAVNRIAKWAATIGYDLGTNDLRVKVPHKQQQQQQRKRLNRD